MLAETNKFTVRGRKRLPFLRERFYKELKVSLARSYLRGQVKFIRRGLRVVAAGNIIAP